MRVFSSYPKAHCARGFLDGGRQRITSPLARLPTEPSDKGKAAQKIEKRKEVETSFLLVCAAVFDSVYLAHFNGEAGRQLGKLESVASRGIRVLQRILRRVDLGVVFAEA